MTATGERPARRRAFLVLALTFVAGLVCGAAILHLGAHAFRPGGPPVGRRGGMDPRPMEHLSRVLDLDADQRARVRALLEDQRGRMEALLEESRQEIRGVLRPDQLERFDRMRPEHLRRHRRPRRGPPPEGPPPPGSPDSPD